MGDEETMKMLMGENLRIMVGGAKRKAKVKR